MMPRIRVLHVQSGMCGGGIETLVSTMAAALQDELESSVFSLAASRAYEGPELPRVDEPHGQLSVPTILSGLLRHVRRWRPDIIHAHSPDAAPYLAILRGLVTRSPRTIFHWHNVTRPESRTRLGALVGRRAIHGADAVIACSNVVAEARSAFYSLPRERVRVLYNPVDLLAYHDPADNRSLRKEVGAGPDETLAVFLGRLEIQHKGLDVLCSASRLLLENCRLRILLVGPGDRDAIANELEPPDSVVFTGAINHDAVPALLRACDVGLQPSRWEGFPLTVIEEMAAGLPVVATPVGGIPEAVADGETGLLVPPEDPQALADAIQWMVEHPEERAEMGRRGRERAMLFDVHTIAAQLEQIYREVLDG